MSLLIKNARYLDYKSLEITHADILAEAGQHGGIRLLRQGEQIPADTVTGGVLDAGGKLLTRAFAVGHHHVYSALARGMPAPPVTPVNFRQILSLIWWTLDRCLDESSIRASALVTAMACARAGASFVIDHHASPSMIDGSLDIIAEAFDEVGLGHLLCYEITDRDGPEKARQGLAESRRYLKNRQGLVGLHASFTVSDESLEAAMDLVREKQSGLHVHVAEDLYDQEHCLATHHKRVVHRLAQAGALSSSRTMLVHGLHLDDSEREILRLSPAWLAQNPESNLNNRVGFFSARGLSDRILLGTDGMHSDMLRSMHTAFFSGQAFSEVGYLEAYQRLRRVHGYLRENEFEGDADNNLVVLDYDPPTEMTSGNLPAHFLFGLNASHVKHLIARGRLIMKDGQFLHLDEEQIMAHARKEASLLWKRMEAMWARGRT